MVAQKASRWHSAITVQRECMDPYAPEKVAQDNIKPKANAPSFDGALEEISFYAGTM
jgi:hypothetical protein